MSNKIEVYLEELIQRYPKLASCREDIKKAYLILEEAFSSGHKLLVAGNGGSAADSEHIVGELMKEFRLSRPLTRELKNKFLEEDPILGKDLAENLQGALPAIALTGHFALSTAYSNDCNPLLCFAQQVNGYGNEGDAFLAISTSGNSRNILYAAITARAKGMKVIGLTGRNECRLSSMVDVSIRVDEADVYKIQELHLPVYHVLCLMLEERFFDNNL